MPRLTAFFTKASEMKSRISLFVLAAAGAACASLSGCGEDGSIGSSLLEDQVQIVVDSSFTISGSSEQVRSIRPRTLTELLGNVTIPGYGTISSSVVAQFLPAVALDTATFTADNVDSIFMNFRYVPGSFIGDSIVPMGVTVYPLTRQLPSDIDSDFSPEGYFSSSDVLGSTVYTASTLDNDSLAKLTTRTVAVKLPVEFGRKLYKAFEDNPDDYAGGAIFTSKVFPGFYARSTFGSGRLLRATRTSMTMHLRAIKENASTGKKDTVNSVQEYYAVAPEVINNNNLSVTLDPALTDRINTGSALLVAPLGYESRLRFPAPEIMAAYRNHGSSLAVLNSVTMSIPVDSVVESKMVGIPPYVLLVLSKDRDDFFSGNKLPDNKTSFYASYDQSSGSYSFTALGTYINELLEREEEIKEEDYTFSLVPVMVNFELDMTSYSQRYIVSEVIPYIEGPVAAELDLENAKIKLTYSKQIQL